MTLVIGKMDKASVVEGTRRRMNCLRKKRMKTRTGSRQSELSREYPQEEGRLNCESREDVLNEESE